MMAKTRDIKTQIRDELKEAELHETIIYIMGKDKWSDEDIKELMKAEEELGL